MQFFILVLIGSFFVFLFFLYSLIKEDTVFMRQNIGSDRIFNLAFSLSLLALFFARLFYIIFSERFQLLNPFYFILISHSPGLSAVGAVLGGVLSLALLSRYLKMPFGHLLDRFSLAFVYSLPIGVLGYFILDGKLLTTEAAATLGVCVLVILLFARVLVRLSERGEIKSGGLGYIFIMGFSFCKIVLNVIFGNASLGPENIILGVSFLVALIIYFGSTTRIK